MRARIIEITTFDVSVVESKAQRAWTQTARFTKLACTGYLSNFSLPLSLLPADRMAVRRVFGSRRGRGGGSRRNPEAVGCV